MLCSFSMLRMRGEGSAPLLFRAAIIQPSWIALECGGADPSVFAETVSKSAALRVARLKMSRREGEMDR